MKKKKYFIITVDTEGDNLWDYKEGDKITTYNSAYIPRFQSLCEKFGFKPVYLTNYEMAQSETFVENAKEWVSKGCCEIGVHLHAWNTPPLYDLKGPYNGNPYLIEYPTHVMYSKFETIYNLILDKFGVRPVSHRAGRWIMNNDYFKILQHFDIQVDCSFTPGINWMNIKGKTIGGCDYTFASPNPCFVADNILEVPMTIIKSHKALGGSVLHKIKTLLKGELLWLRSASSNINQMKHILDVCSKNDNYVEFMIHSSELMPGGSPYFRNSADIEQEFSAIQEIFEYAFQKGYIGCTLAEYKNLLYERE